MHGSGIQLTPALKNSFLSAQQSGALYVKFTIVREENVERFHLASQGSKSSGNRETDFETVKRALGSQACYITFKPHGEAKWILVFYVPQDTTVRDRMVYSTSVAALKEGLGSSQFVASGWNLSDANDFSLAEYESKGKVMDENELLTWDEQQALAAETSSHLSMSSVKISAIVGLPIKASDDAIDALKAMASGSVHSIIFALHSDSEVLMVENKGNLSYEDIASKLPQSEPRYAIKRFAHEHEGKSASTVTFHYYCPDEIKPKLKMFYSTCKSVVLKVCEQFGVPVEKSIEVSERSEISTSQVLNDLYPPVSVKKTFAKPGRPGKGKARLITDKE